MSDAVDATPALLSYEELDDLIDEWTDLVSCPHQPVPLWQMISLTVDEVLYRARQGRLIYSDDAHEAAAMVTAAGTWRLERDGSDPYADWRARALPVLARIAERSPRRPAGHRNAWPPNSRTASPTGARTSNCGRRRRPSHDGTILPMRE